MGQGRDDLHHRNDLGFFTLKHGEPLAKQGFLVRLFESDCEKIKAIAPEKGVPPSELIRMIVREWLEKGS
jgi:predicted DNA binding CopG/RHH family protein